MDAGKTITTFGLDENMQRLVNNALDVFNHCEKPLHEAPEEVLSATDIAIIFIFSDVNKDVCSIADLDAVISLGAGTDHIDDEVCRDHGITVCNTPHYGSRTVAEHTFSLLLSYERHMRDIENQSLSFPRHEYLSHQLAGNTFGAIGTGGIGKAAVQIAQGFAMDTIGYDVEHDRALKEDDDFSYATKNDVYREADYIGLYVPAISATKNMVDEHALGLMSNEAVLINTARAHVLDHEAVLHALNRDRLRGALLDVVDQSHASAFKAHPKSIVTPHHAFYTEEALDNMVEQAKRAVNAIRRGDRPQTALPKDI